MIPFSDVVRHKVNGAVSACTDIYEKYIPPRSWILQIEESGTLKAREDKWIGIALQMK